MADDDNEKTEDPTPKKRSDAANKGQVPKSQLEEWIKESI